MKTLACLALAASTLVSPALSFAQTAAPVTRAAVRADLIRLEQAGYRPSAGEDVYYPADVQAAEAKVVAAEQQQPGGDAVGGAPMGSSEAGSKAPLPKAAPSPCVGPASFCDIYFGS